MTSVLLIYPYFKPALDRSIFRFPPLGVSYIAASLLEAGHDVHLLDCTFLNRRAALRMAMLNKVEVIGIYCMATMLEDCLWFASQLRGSCQLMVAGGPLPTCDPATFMDHFDVVVRGEGEHSMVELLHVYERGSDFSSVPGIVYRTTTHQNEKGERRYAFSANRPFIKDLDRIALPARELLPNQQYIQHGNKKYGYSISTVMSTRGCPYRCEFCSNVVFGGSYRERSPENVVDEIEEVLRLGYERVSFADDVFTLNRGRVTRICEEIRRRGLEFSWECLGRVDTIDYDTALEMKKSGCNRIFFGIESGNDRILKLMNKKIATEQARAAVEAARRAGLQVGAFFILFYPGETDDTVLDTLRFATSLPLDYLGLTMPFILPGTALNERVEESMMRHHPEVDYGLQVNNALVYNAEVSKTKMWFAILKGRVQYWISRRSGRLAPLFLQLFEKPSDALLRLLR
jgi:anaerobic magnesium-protoporphyrin IX monomethyl ester cyclase